MGHPLPDRLFRRQHRGFRHGDDLHRDAFDHHFRHGISHSELEIRGLQKIREEGLCTTCTAFLKNDRSNIEKQKIIDPCNASYPIIRSFQKIQAA